MNNFNNIYITKDEPNYELLDSGDGEKLERFGKWVIRRPDPQIIWCKNKPADFWAQADAVYERKKNGGVWKKKEGIADEWTVEICGVTFVISLSRFKHTGVFPEQISNWQWMEEKVKTAVDAGQKVSVLNLFGYTGGASLVCAKAGASVCHLDASKTALTWMDKNKKASALDNASIRLILDDARKFVEKEIRRGVKYDAIIMDPPTYGRGAKDELWTIDKDLLPLLSRVVLLLSSRPIFLILNGYASEYSNLAYYNAISGIMSGAKIATGQTEAGQLAIKETDTDRLLPAGICARYNFQK